MSVPIRFQTAASSRITVSDASATNLAASLLAAGETKAANEATTWMIYVVSGTVNFFKGGNTPTAAVGTPLSAGKYYVVAGSKADQINLIGVGAPAEISVEGSTSELFATDVPPAGDGAGATVTAIDFTGVTPPVWHNGLLVRGSPEHRTGNVDPRKKQQRG